MKQCIRFSFVFSLSIIIFVFFHTHDARAGLIFKVPNNLGLTNGLVGWWNFDGKTISGTRVFDASGNGTNQSQLREARWRINFVMLTNGHQRKPGMPAGRGERPGGGTLHPGPRARSRGIPARSVYLYHITYKPDAGQRYTMYWDPERRTWQQ